MLQDLLLVLKELVNGKGNAIMDKINDTKDVPFGSSPVPQGIQDYKQFIKEIRAPEAGRFKQFQTPCILSVIRALPKFTFGEEILRKLILDDNEHNNITLAAISTYKDNYQDKFEDLVNNLISKTKRTIVVDKAITELFQSRLATKKSEEFLYNKVTSYTPFVDELNKHVITLAIFYLGIKKKLKDEDAIKIINGEMSLDTDSEFENFLERKLYFTTIPVKPALLRLAVEVLGKIETKRAEEFLIWLIDNSTSLEAKRAAIKSLSNYPKSEAARDKLLTLLEDKDNWSRLIAYLSLKRMTHKKHDYDWFFSKPEELKPQIKTYIELIKGK